LDYDLDTSEERPQSTTNNANRTNSIPTTQQTSSKPISTTSNATNYATKLQSLKNEIESLKAVIATAVEQFQSAIKSLTAHPPPASSVMDTDDETTMDTTNQNHIDIDIPTMIHDLKHKIATFVIETCALLNHCSSPTIQNNHLSSKT